MSRKNPRQRPACRRGLPCFCPVLPEDSLFLPRCGHAAGSHFASGAGKWGDCQMIIKASGRSALILATGLFVCFAGPSPTMAASADTTSKSDSATAAKSVQQTTRHWKRTVQRKSNKVASKPDETSKAADVTDAATPPAIPASVANANAQLTPADSPAADSAKAMTAKANTVLLAAADKP